MSPRVAFLAPAAVALVFGVLAGLARLGWSVSVPGPAISWHGALMVSGFFGTLISLERAVALGRAWAYAAPVCAGAAGLAWLFGAHPWIGGGLALAASTVMVAASIYVVVRQRAVFTVTMALGAAAWWMGNLLWLVGVPPREMVQWWTLFFVLTIAGERLELSRLAPRSAGAERAFVVVAAVLFAAAGAMSFERELAERVLGVALVAITIWLARYDIGRRTWRTAGLPRYAAIAIYSGYGWLLIAGLIWIRGAAHLMYGYDAALHAVFLGFVVSMVFAHAPIILPAVARVPIRYGPALYAPLALLHVTLAIRVVGGLVGEPSLLRIGGMGNALTLVLFVLGAVVSSVRAPKPAASRA